MARNDRKIMIDIPEANITIPAILLDQDEPEGCKLFWDVLEKPMRMICHHTLSTGDYFQACGRPPVHPVAVGSQASPIGRKRSLLCRLEPGSILYAGGHDIAVAYGPNITEPLMGRGPVVARTPADSMDDVWKAGRVVWNAQYMTHRLVTITVRREER